MLLHKLYINVAFANILLHTMSLQNHPGPKYEKKDDIFPKTKKDLVVLTRQCLLRGPRFKELIWEKRGSLILASTATLPQQLPAVIDF